MDADLLFSIGVILLVLAAPAAVSAFSDSRPPRAAAILLLLGGGLLALAIWQRPTGYSVAEIPDVIARVIGRYLR